MLHVLEQGAVHLGLVGRKAEQPHWEFQFLAHDHLVLIVPPGHLLAEQRQLRLVDLTVHPLVVRESGSGLRHCLEKSLEQAGLSLQACTIAVEMGNNEAVKEAVRRGLGIAVISASVVSQELANQRFVAVEIPGLLCDRDLFLVRHRRCLLPRAARRFWAVAQTLFPGNHKPS